MGFVDLNNPGELPDFNEEDLNLSFIEKNTDVKQNTEQNQNEQNVEIIINESPETRKKRRTKEDLDKTPLPIFDCIYCSSEKIVFDHMSREIVSDKYLYNCSNWDYKKINEVITNPLVINLKTNDNLRNIMLFVNKFSEYLNKFYKKEESSQKLSKIIEKNSNYKKLNPLLSPYLKPRCSTFESTYMFKPSNAAKLKTISNSNENKATGISKICNEMSPNFSNFYSTSINYQKYEEEVLLKHNIQCNNLLESVENIKEELKLEGEEEQELSENISSESLDHDGSFLDFLRLDSKKRIRKEDISWESSVQDIWNPNLSSRSQDEEKAENLMEKFNENVNLLERNPNSDGNFSLQFSNNSSQINNLFDTNSNLKNVYVDKSINIKDTSHNVSISNALQFKTVLSCNYDINTNDNLSVLLNKSDNLSNNARGQSQKTHLIKTNPSTIQDQLKYLTINTDSKNEISFPSGLNTKPNICNLLKVPSFNSNKRKAKYDSGVDFTKNVIPISNNIVKKEKSNQIIKNNILLHSLDKLKPQEFSPLGKEGNFRHSQDYSDKKLKLDLAKITNNKKINFTKFSEFNAKRNSAYNNSNKLDSFNLPTDRSNTYMSPKNSSKILLYSSTKNSSNLFSSSSLHSNQNIYSTIDFKFNSNQCHISSLNTSVSNLSYSNKVKNNNNSFGFSKFKKNDKFLSLKKDKSQSVLKNSKKSLFYLNYF
jgi:hypothetical protein